jgi:hypothetical protein
MHKVLDHVPVKVTSAMNETLTRPFIQEEVKTALFQMVPIKASRPDGFPTYFSRGTRIFVVMILHGLSWILCKVMNRQRV